MKERGDRSLFNNFNAIKRKSNTRISILCSSKNWLDVGWGKAGFTKHDRYFIECPPPSCIVGLFGGQPVIFEMIINPGYILPTLQGDRTGLCRFGMFKAIRANIVSDETTEDEVAQVQ